jgi:ABC-2 type transport system permease protein
MHSHGGGVPNFALHLFTGMVFIHYFSETWSGGTRSIWSNRGLVLKMRMPREIFPVAAMFVAVYHTAPQVLILVITAALVGWHFTWSVLAAAALGLGILITFSTAMSLLFAALNVYYKDFQNIVATFSQFIHFMVPMMYPYSFIHQLGESHPVIYQIYMANPLAEAVILMQKVLWLPTLSDQELPAAEMPADLWTRGVIMLVASVALLVFAQKVFTRLEAKFPERL